MKLILIAIISLLIIGCGSVKPQLTHIKTVYKNTPVVCIEAPKVEKLELYNVKWIKAKDDQEMPVIALTPDDYEKLGINTQRLLKHIKENNAVKWYYIKCIE